MQTRTKQLSLFLLAAIMTLILPLLAQASGDSGVAPRLTATSRPPTTSMTHNGVYIRSHRVDVDITDQIARTRIEQVYVNETNRDAEGTFVFPLPHGVTITDLVMVVDGVRVQAQVLEAEEARAVYTEIVRRMRDPALLEYVGTNAIQARVFPIPPNQERTLEIEYSQLLTVENGLVHYEYPLRTEHVSRLPVGQLSIRVEVESNDPISSIYSPTHGIDVHRRGDNAFVAGFENTQSIETNDFSLYYGIAGDGVSVNLVTYRESAGEDGYFLVLVAPPVGEQATRVIPKDVVIVLDQSGSMDEGTKWPQASEAANFVLDNLNPEDRFNVVLFATGVRIFSTQWQSPEMADDAQAWLAGESPLGGTNIGAALATALEMNEGERQTVVLFLTDGLPTEGITDLETLLSNVEARTQPNVRFFTFGVGENVNTFLLDELSGRHHGSSEYVRTGESVEETVTALYSRVTAPVLTDLELDFGGMNVYEVYPQPLPDLFLGSQLMVVGRYQGADPAATLTLHGQIEQDGNTYVYEELNFRANAGGEALVARLWANRRIGHLLNVIRLQGPNDELIDSVVRLSIRYGIITPYTSFLITEEDILTQGDREAQAMNFAPTATAMSMQQSGASAVDAAQSAGQFAQSTMAPTYAPMMVMTATPPPTATQSPLGTGLPATPTALGTPAPTAEPELVIAPGTLRGVGDRTFVYRDETWIDTTYDPDIMEPIEIEFLSDEYFELLAADDRVPEFLALGDHVIFVLDGVAYEIVPA